jgi:hypothetical protein
MHVVGSIVEAQACESCQALVADHGWREVHGGEVGRHAHAHVQAVHGGRLGKRYGISKSRAIGETVGKVVVAVVAVV